MHYYYNRKLVSTMAGSRDKFKELSVEDRVKTCINYSFCARCLIHGHAVRECKFTSYTFKYVNNQVVCGSSKHHQLLHGSKNMLVNIVNRSMVREAIEDPEEKIDFKLTRPCCRFKGGTKGIVFWDGGATIVLIRHGFAEKLGQRGQF